MREDSLMDIDDKAVGWAAGVASVAVPAILASPFQAAGVPEGGSSVGP
jgi:hypothetical protein